MPPPPYTATHHVRRVHLQARQSSLIQRAAILLEDALHTASLPTAGRFILVRHLTVGTIDTNRSSASLSLTVEQRVSQLMATAVYALDPTAATATVVYFQDSTEPYYLLALRLAQGVHPEGWFWPLAVQEWQPDLGQGTGLRRILQSLAQRESGMAAVIPLIQQLQTIHRLPPLLGALQPTDGTALVQAAGWSWPPPIGSQPSPSIDLSPDSQITLATWINQWGCSDARTHWLAAMVWIAEKPGRMLRSDVGARSQQLIHQVAAHFQLADLAASPTNLPPAGRKSRILPNPTAHPAPDLKMGAMAREEGQTTVDNTPLPSALHPRPKPEGGVPFDSWAIGAPDPALPPPSISQPSAVPHHRPSFWFQATDSGPTTRQGTPTDQVVPPSTPAAWREEPAVQSPEASQSIGNFPREGTEQPTVCGGFFFVLVLLSRLEVGAFLRSNPAAIEANFVLHLLQTLACRLAIPPSDPIYQIFPLESPWQPLPAWTIPGGWLNHRLVSAPWHYQPASDGTYLWDGAGQICLGHWSGKAPATVHQLVASGTQMFSQRPVIHRMPPGSSSPSDPLLPTWQMALQRLCCRYGRMGLQRLVYRSGWLRITRTHLDVTLPLDQAEVRIRRAGLDLDPGWVPWLGRVVQFHYREQR